MRKSVVAFHEVTQARRWLRAQTWPPAKAQVQDQSPGTVGRENSLGTEAQGGCSHRGRGRGSPTALILLNKMPAAQSRLDPGGGPLPASPRRSRPLLSSAVAPRGQAWGWSLSETRPLAPSSRVRALSAREGQGTGAAGGRRQTSRPRLRQETRAQVAPCLLLADSWPGGEGVGEDCRLTDRHQGP